MPDYFICGLSVRSELELPGAVPDKTGVAPPAVSVRRGSVPVSLRGATASGPDWEMAGETFLMRVQGLARFAIEGGREIMVDIEPGAWERNAVGFILGTAFGILLHQRGALVLHGAAVEKDGRAIAICGASGAGKSTLAAALCREGCSFVTDDICVVDIDEPRRPVVLPDGRRLKLWKESIDRLDFATRQGEAVSETFEKYYIDPFDSVAAPPKLSAFYVLRETSSATSPRFESLPLPDAMQILEIEAYRPELRQIMGRKPELFAKSAAVLGYARAFLLHRPRGFDHLTETVTSLRAHWDTLG
jgi:hypothetical protein